MFDVYLYIYIYIVMTSIVIICVLVAITFLFSHDYHICKSNIYNPQIMANIYRH